MLSKLEKLLELVNALLIKLIEASIRLVPPAFKARLEAKLLKLKTLQLKAIERTKHLGLPSPQELKVKAIGLPKVVIPLVKEKIESTKLKFKTYLEENSIKGLSDWMKLKLGLVWASISWKLREFSLTGFMITTSVIAVVAVSGYKIYSSTTNILDHGNPKRGPAAVPDVTAAPKGIRPFYYKNDARQQILSDLTVPIYLKSDGAKGTTTMLVDLSLEVSNRALVYYIKKHDIQIKNFLISNIEPITADFLLGNEGKDIIKEKILSEINRFLKEQNIEGHVRQVYIEAILES